MLRFWNFNRNIWWKFSSLESNSQSGVNFHACFRHSVAGAGTLRPLKVTSRGNGRRQNMMDQYPKGRMEQFAKEFDDADELENLASRISKYASKADARTAEAEHTRNMIGQLKSYRYRTIEHKFFRKPTPPDLLTWAAKEQIRYLHTLDPEEWSVLALSDLFPVSEEIIRQTIKSRVRMIREKDILQHDMDVQKNWEDLMVSLENEDPAISDDVVQAFKNSQDEIVIQNAIGIQDLPFSVRNRDRFYPRGEFSAIVKDCYDAKKKALKDSREKLQAKSQDISVILSKATDILKMKFEKKKNSRLIKIKNDKKSRISSSAAHHTEQVAVRNKHNFGPLNQENNIPERIGTIMAQKYKDSLFNNSAEECGSVKRNIPHKVHVKPEAQQRNGSSTYIAGDCVYDKSGIFLYRIP